MMGTNPKIYELRKVFLLRRVCEIIIAMDFLTVILIYLSISLQN